MSPSGDASPKSWISPTTVTWFISLVLAAIGVWYGTDRRDSDAVTALRERVVAIETQMLERKASRDAQMVEILRRIDQIDRRDNR